MLAPLSTVNGGRAATRQGARRSGRLAGGKLYLRTYQAREREHHLRQARLQGAGHHQTHRNDMHTTPRRQPADRPSRRA